MRFIANCKLHIANCKLRTVKPRRAPTGTIGHRRAALVGMVDWSVAVIVMGIWFFSGGCGEKLQDLQSSSAEKNPARSVVERGPVKVTAEVQPAKARLSDEPVLTLTIEYEAGVEVEKPPFGQALGSFVIRDFHQPLPKTRNGREIIEQAYTLEPTATGRLLIDPINVTFIDLRPNGDEKTHTIQTEALTVEIGSLVGENVPSLENLRPAVGPLALPGHRQILAWSLVAAGVILAFVGWWLWRRSRREKIETAVVLSAEELALMELEKLARSGLAETDVKQFYVELTGIVRRYIERTTGIRAPEETTEEFLREISQTNSFQGETSERLRNFLESADLVKFAAHRPRNEDIEESMSRARIFIGQKTQEPAGEAAEAMA